MHSTVGFPVNGTKLPFLTKEFTLDSNLKKIGFMS
jgi:hypothetical protein